MTLHPVNGDTGSGWHPELFPEKDGGRLRVWVPAVATSAVACPTCHAAAGEPCVFHATPAPAAGMVHRQRLAVDLDEIIRVDHNGEPVTVQP
jgi:hypothetical protein